MDGRTAVITGAAGGLGRIALPPVRPCDPVANLGLAVVLAHAGAADCLPVRRAHDQEVGAARILPSRGERTRLVGPIGPRRAREIAHDAFVGDAAQDGFPVLGPGGPQEQPCGTMEHVVSPLCPAPAR